MRIIPAIDIIEGKCVRLTKGDYATQKIYNEDPLEVAKAFEDSGSVRADIHCRCHGYILQGPILENISS